VARPWVEQQLVGVEAVTVLGLIRAVRTQAIDEAGADAFDKTVENTVGGAVQRVLLEFARAARIEDAQFDLGGVVGEDGDVDATVSGESAEGFGAAFLNAFWELQLSFTPRKLSRRQVQSLRAWQDTPNALLRDHMPVRSAGTERHTPLATTVLLKTASSGF
jgi:acylphosphatase